MSAKDMFDVGYYGIIMVYVAVKFYSQNHTFKNKWVA